MRKLLSAAAVAAACISGAYLGLAQQPANGTFSFFITSAGPGRGADLGGLAGADRQCQTLAAAAGANQGTWRAYLSVQARNGQPAVNARDRIGPGPFFNVKGVMIARSVDELHSDQNNLNKQTGLTEKGGTVLGFGDQPNQHDMLTGSMPDGRVFSDGVDHTCDGYTSSQTTGQVRVGHFDKMGGGQRPNSWNSAHESRGCSQQGLVSTGGNGLFYCFRVDALN